MDLTPAEETYLQAIARLTGSPHKTVSTNAIAAHVSTSAASVTDMLKKLAAKKLIAYEKYQGAHLTESGNRIATSLIRKHRLWETFLAQSLGMTWDEVHDLALQLEHIQSDDLVNRLEAFLGFPKFDPHGDPIPNAQGRYTLRSQISLAQLSRGQTSILIGVRSNERSFLQHLSEKGIALGKSVTLMQKDEFDQMVHVKIDEQEFTLSGQVAAMVMVKAL